MLHAISGLLLLTTISAMSQYEFKREVASRHLGTNRTVRVRLPQSYWSEPGRRYPVLYVHDGQNVFASAGTNCCFGWGSWQLDTTAARLAAEGRMQEIIIVAVDNSRYRYQEYRGPAPDDGKSRYTNYAAFLVKELKPLIDKEYRTKKTPRDTAVLGSSMGGICSIALSWEHPKTFGAAASLSGAFQVEKRHFIEHVLKTYKDRVKPVRFYLDSGTIDFTGDDDGRRHTVSVVNELRRIGWKDGKDLQHFVQEQSFSDVELQRSSLPQHKCDEAKKSHHNEFYWRERVWRALVFLFPPKD